jgi:hypothetical protein
MTMISTLTLSVPSDPLSPLPVSTIDQAIQLLKLSSLSADQQIAIEHAITLLAQQKNWNRTQSALWLHNKACSLSD